VKVDEPSEEDAIVMLRGLAPVYEKSHGVRILDEAVVAAVRLSSRYIAGRMLPDKAVDLLDTTAARVRTEHEAKPEALVDVEQRVAALVRAETALRRDLEMVGGEHNSRDLEEVCADLEVARAELSELVEKWQRAKKKLDAELARRNPPEADAAADAQDDGAEESATDEAGEAAEAGEGDAQAAAESDEAGTQNPDADANEHEGEALINVDVNANAVAGTISSWTGIPLGSMQRGSMGTALELEDTLAKRVIGQQPAVEAIGEAVRASLAGVGNPDSPTGVLLFVGSSGVGKTETALAIADLLYGGERFITTINMSEFMEKHSVSKLIGSPPGYVGYGEGGVLSEAVRQRPYSVVLLDEVEKADPEVMNLFYQVFDKGTLNDGEGRAIDFKNTIIIMTSNLATDEIMRAYEAETPPEVDALVSDIRPILSKHFKPALLARMTIVPFRPIGADSMRDIASIKIRSLSKRIESTYGFKPVIKPEVIDEIAKRCTESETGARNIDHILRGNLTPMIARRLLEVLSDGETPTLLEVSLSASGEFRVDVDSES
jgi:type VI secretion system protein VasG